MVVSLVIDVAWTRKFGVYLKLGLLIMSLVDRYTNCLPTSF